MTITKRQRTRYHWETETGETYTEPAEGRCHEVNCGRLVILENSMTNTCDCGAQYNGVGQQLSLARCNHWLDY